jgi:hypothetical protein
MSAEVCSISAASANMIKDAFDDQRWSEEANRGHLLAVFQTRQGGRPLITVITSQTSLALVARMDYERGSFQDSKRVMGNSIVDRTLPRLSSQFAPT